MLKYISHPVFGNYVKGGRGAIVTTNRRLPRPFYLSLDRSRYYRYTPKVLKKSYGGSYAEIEDRRRWNPEGEEAPAKSFDQPRHRLRAVLPSRQSRPASSYSFGYGGYSSASAPVGIGFVRPSRVLVCVRRKIRREVIHANGYSGLNGFRKYRRSSYSGITC